MTPSIRPLTQGDSVEELTALLHRAYAPLAARGLRYWASWQTVQDTRRRVGGGLCLVATQAGRIVGTIAYQRATDWQGSDWMRRPEVANTGQFAVEPSLQKRGLGGELLRRVEALARGDGAAELALSTAEPATHLVGFYTRRGYRVVEHTDATRDQGYRSVILSKTL